jgi:LEA14-like dessication related protein
MLPNLRARSTLALAVAAPLLVACTKPKPPTLVPKGAQVTGIDPKGVTIDLTVEMTNPNGFAIEVQDIRGRVVLADGSDLGEVNVTHAVSLPSNVPTLVKVPITANWAGMGSLAAMALGGKDLPFTVSGSVGVGTPSWNVGVPYSVSGTVTQDQLKRVVASELGKLKLPLPLGSVPLPPR